MPRRRPSPPTASSNAPRDQRKKAVALRYDRSRDEAPVVVAKGAGSIAEKIIALAQECGIHIHEDADLVEVLAHLNLNEAIPPATYVVVAEILAFVYRRNQSFKS